jgi:hypothetical protein
LERLELRNAWNCVSPKRFERSEQLNVWNDWNGSVPVMNGAKRWNPSIKLLCGCQAHYTRDLFFSFFFMTFLLPDQRETCCYSWHDRRPSHLLGMRPSLGHTAPGSLSQGSNRQEFFSPGSVNRRVAPWGDVCSWVKGAE